MNSRTIRRLERLEKFVPGYLVVEYLKNSDPVRKTMIEFCKECRSDGLIYNFEIVDGNRMEDIDLLINLIDDYAKDKL